MFDKHTLKKKKKSFLLGKIRHVKHTYKYRLVLAHPHGLGLVGPRLEPTHTGWSQAQPNLILFGLTNDPKDFFIKLSPPTRAGLR